jgi:hypothetical protein
VKQESFAFWGEQKGNLAGSFALSDAEWSTYFNYTHNARTLTATNIFEY